MRSNTDAIVPVPLHPRRLRQRTFNQADEIARPLARAIRVPLIVRGIHRHRHTEAQTALSRAARLAGPAQAFAVSNRSLRGLTIAVVDDVITTGATVNALAAALRAAGAQSVVAWAVARTPGDDGGQSRRNR
jgi:ComF family protein